MRALLPFVFVLSCAPRDPPAPPAPDLEILVRPDSLIVGVGALPEVAVAGAVIAVTGARAAIAAAPESPAEFVVDTVPRPPSRVIAGRGRYQSGRRGTAAPIAPAARVIDAAGNPIAGNAVHFAVTAGGGELEHVTATTGADGAASPGRWKLAAKGVNSLEASVDGVKAPALFSARAR